SQHDFGSKTIYGTAANYGGEDVIPIIAARRATARFLVRKLFNFFVYPVDASGADQSTIEKYADVYFSNDHSIAKLLRAIFTSDEFFSDRARFALVKSPPEFVVGAIRMLGATYNPGTSSFQDGAQVPSDFSTLLGQELLNPPDVSGWPGGLAWINTSTLLNRYTFADVLASTRPSDSNAPGVFAPPDLLRKYARANVAKTVGRLVNTLGLLVLDETALNNLSTYLQTGINGLPAPFHPNDAGIDQKARGLVHLAMCLPEFQLN
ncbi:MAG TPA: DUF1800 family protein, partial [Blastocatellia bacterium]|nr:DUF1800 family protein [Blastocatellia bacterium]